MASGSVQRADLICKEAESFEFDKSVAISSTATASANQAGYVIPNGFLGIFAGYTGETTASTNNTMPFNMIYPTATGANSFFVIRNNATSGSSTTRHISIKITFIKAKYVDDRRE